MNQSNETRNMPGASSGEYWLPHAVKKNGRYLPAVKHKQTVPPFNVGRQFTSVIRGYAYDSRQAALEHAKASIVRGKSIQAANAARLAVSRASATRTRLITEADIEREFASLGPDPFERGEQR